MGASKQTMLYCSSKAELFIGVFKEHHYDSGSHSYRYILGFAIQGAFGDRDIGDLCRPSQEKNAIEQFWIGVIV